jgi:hypothetical protein
MIDRDACYGQTLNDVRPSIYAVIRPRGRRELSFERGGLVDVDQPDAGAGDDGDVYRPAKGGDSRKDGDVSLAVRRCFEEAVELPGNPNLCVGTCGSKEKRNCQARHSPELLVTGWTVSLPGGNRRYRHVWQEHLLCKPGIEYLDELGAYGSVL